MIGASFGNYASSGVTPFSFGNALKFDGVNDYVSLPSSLPNNTGTLSLWFNTPQYGAFTVIGNSLLNNCLLQFWGANTIRIGGSSGIQFFSFTNNYNLNSWNHLVITKNAGLTTCYVNSIKTTTADFNTNDFSYNQFGRYLTNPNWYNGKLDEIGFIENIIASQTQVNELYNSGNGSNFETIMGSSTAYWRCNEADGAATLTDETGNYNGTLNNFSTPPAYFIPH